MKYEPPSIPEGDDITQLMMPFVTKGGETDWQAISAVEDCVHRLASPHREIIEMVFYDRLSYSQLAERLGTKAKSYAWRQCQKAIRELEKLMKQHPYLQDKYGH